MTELDKLVFDCQEESIALVMALGKVMRERGLSGLDIARQTELLQNNAEHEMWRVFQAGAPDEIDLEAFVRVAYLLGYKVVLEERKND